MVPRRCHVTRKLSHGARMLSCGARKMSYGARMMSYGARQVSTDHCQDSCRMSTQLQTVKKVQDIQDRCRLSVDSGRL